MQLKLQSPITRKPSLLDAEATDAAARAQLDAIAASLNEELSLNIDGGTQLAAVATPAQPGTPAAPHKTPQGTSYSADGLVAPPDTGVESGSSRGVVIREIVPALVSPYQRTIEYAKMMNDAGVDVSMRVAKTPVLGAEFYVDPYDDQPINLEIGEFIEANLYGGMNAPFINSLEDILHFYEDGYAILEEVFELREWTPRGKGRNTKTYTMLKKLGVRPPSTIKEIKYDDNGGPVQVLQGAIRADGTIDEVPISIDKAMIFTFGRRGGDLTGRSLLRTAYEHWYYKKHLYKIDAIQKERHGIGVPKAKLEPGYNPNNLPLLRKMLANLRTNEEAFMLLFPFVDVTLEAPQGQLVDVMESADHHNMMILMNVLAQFLSLGHGSSQGNRAVAGTGSDIYMKALKFVAEMIAEVINMYLIPKLTVYNYNTKNFPKLKVRGVGDTRDLQTLGSALSSLLAQGAFTMDLATENWFRRVFSMPSKADDGEYVTAQPGLKLTPGVTSPNLPASRNGDAPQKGNVKPSKGGNKPAPVNAS